jgi:hypothetical protein
MIGSQGSDLRHSGGVPQEPFVFTSSNCRKTSACSVENAQKDKNVGFPKNWGGNLEVPVL